VVGNAIIHVFWSHHQEQYISSMSKSLHAKLGQNNILISFTSSVKIRVLKPLIKLFTNITIHTKNEIDFNQQIVSVIDKGQRIMKNNVRQRWSHTLYTVKLGYNEQILSQICQFSTQINPVITNRGCNEQKWPVPSCSLFNFHCSIISKTLNY
jgi:hypothetical protein